MTSRANSLTARATPAFASAAEPPVGVNGVVPFVQGLSKLGFDTPALLAAAGMDPAVLRDPDGLIPCRQFGALIGAASSQRRVKNLALHLAAVTPIGAFPLFDYLILTCSTVADGLVQIARFMPLVSNPTQLGVHLDESPARVTLDSPGATFNVEFSAAICVLSLTRGDRTTLLAAGAPLRASSGGCRRVRESAESAGDGRIDVERAVAVAGKRAAAAATARPDTSGVLESAARGTSLTTPDAGVVGDLRRALAPRLTGGDLRVRSVASAMGVSPRTLQRRLAAEAETYNGVLDALRCDAAAGYLSGGTLSVGEIAFLLGYSEPAAFHRAFKRWHGVTPAVYRLTIAD